MISHKLKIAVLTLLILIEGIACADSDTLGTNNQTQMAQAAEQFDAFASLMPEVITEKLNDYRKRGFRAILMDDSQTKPKEEKMIQSLIGGLQSIGSAFEEEMNAYEASRRAKEEQSLRN